MVVESKAVENYLKKIGKKESAATVAILYATMLGHALNPKRRMHCKLHFEVNYLYWSYFCCHFFSVNNPSFVSLIFELHLSVLSPHLYVSPLWSTTITASIYLKNTSTAYKSFEILCLIGLYNGPLLSQLV